MKQLIQETMTGPRKGPVCLVAWLPFGAGEASALDARLAPNERQRLGAIRDADQWRRHAASSILGRALLGNVTGTAPSRWTVASGALGAPQVLFNGVAQSGLHISRTRADGLAAVALVTEGAVGIDVEAVSRRNADEAVARQFFSLEEQHWLENCEPGAWEDGFFRIWTLKEAYIKARGLGFGLPLDSFSVLPAKEGVHFSATPAAGHVGEGWSFLTGAPTPRHRLALATSIPTLAPLLFEASLDRDHGVTFQVAT